MVATAIEHSGRVHRITGLGLARGTRSIERIVALNAAFRSLAGDTARREDMSRFPQPMSPDRGLPHAHTKREQ